MRLVCAGKLVVGGALELKLQGQDGKCTSDKIVAVPTASTTWSPTTSNRSYVDDEMRVELKKDLKSKVAPCINFLIAK
jgi:hypothetical protein